MELERKYRINLKLLEIAEANLYVVTHLLLPLQTQILLPLTFNVRESICSVATDSLNLSIQLCAGIAKNEAYVFAELGEMVERQVAPATAMNENFANEVAKINVMAEKWRKLYDEATRIVEKQENLQKHREELSIGNELSMPHSSDILSYIDYMENFNRCSGHSEDSLFGDLKEYLKMLHSML